MRKALNLLGNFKKEDIKYLFLGIVSIIRKIEAIAGKLFAGQNNNI